MRSLGSSAHVSKWNHSEPVVPSFFAIEHTCEWFGWAVGRDVRGRNGFVDGASSLQHGLTHGAFLELGRAPDAHHVLLK
jgi:hypothetical protein